MEVSKYVFKYSPDMIEFLKRECVGRSNSELARMFTEHFGIEKTAHQISSVKKRYNLKSGLDGRFKSGHAPTNKGRKVSAQTYEKMKNSNTWYSKGNQPYNTLPLNTVKKDQLNGYWYHKYNMHGKTKRGRWILLHHEIWIKAHGPIPQGYVVIFLDGNKDNLALDNLAMIKRSTNARLNQMHLRFNDRDTTRTAITHAQLKEAIFNIEHNRKERPKSKKITEAEGITQNVTPQKNNKAQNA
ncbi:HNH endonuclease signature motif containing protein [uncultured Succinivibrio sp.]|uniref:HNH endonuclease signature motif containing protein n=1 Tax=uncultured Succinivibrio sp. TaxID=540749 RepID=UPI0025F5037F|nr:HNH endonuclease signature motif containing protein [uncultured Succinivibrio sp.]